MNVNVNPFLFQISSKSALWALEERNEKLIKNVLRKTLRRMNTYSEANVLEVFDMFISHFSENPHREFDENYGDENNNMTGYMCKEAENLALWYSLKVYRKNEVSIIESDDDNENTWGVNINYIKSNSATPEELAQISDECDSIFNDELDIFDEVLIERGMPRHFDTRSWITAMFLMGAEDISASAEMLGMKRATLEGWNRKIIAIFTAEAMRAEEIAQAKAKHAYDEYMIVNDRKASPEALKETAERIANSILVKERRKQNEFTYLHDSIATLIKGVFAGWEPPVAWAEDEVEDAAQVG